MMKSKNNPINLDDFAKHLRIINFTILIIPTGLFIAAILRTDNSLRKAYSDLEIISDNMEKLDEYWLYNYADATAREYSKTHDEELPSVVFIDFPDKKLGPGFTEFYLPQEKWSVIAAGKSRLFAYSNPDPNFYLARKLIYKHRMGESAAMQPLKLKMLKPGTVLVFKKLWDFLNSPHYIYYPIKVSEKATVKTIYDEGAEKTTEECRIYPDKPKGQKVQKSKLKTDFKQIEEKLEKGEDILESYDVRLCAVTEFRVRSQEQNFPWDKAKVKLSEEKYRIEIPIICARQPIFPAREFMQLTGISRPEVSFNLAFTELNEYVEKYPDISYTSLLRVLKDLKDSGQEYFELFGIKIPSIYLTYCGLGAIIIISFYFWIHLKQITTLAWNNTWDCSIAWIGMYNNFGAKFIMVVSVLIVPLLIALYLSITGFGEFSRQTSSPIILSGLGIQILLTLLILRQLTKWWRVIKKVE